MDIDNIFSGFMFGIGFLIAMYFIFSVFFDEDDGSLSELSNSISSFKDRRGLIQIVRILLFLLIAIGLAITLLIQIFS